MREEFNNVNTSMWNVYFLVIDLGLPVFIAENILSFFYLKYLYFSHLF